MRPFALKRPFASSLLAHSPHVAYNCINAMGRDILSMPSPKADACIHYGADQYQFGDLRLPSTPSPHPVVIGIHGGYYRAMYGLDYYGPLCESLRAAGI